MRELNFKDCINNIGFVKDSIDNTWLNKEIEKINLYKPPKKLRKLSYLDSEEQFHPLALLFHKVQNQVKSCIENKFFDFSPEMMRLSRLGESLYVLKKSNAINLENKISDLTSSNKELFEKTYYEIDVAAAYTKRGYPIEFMKTESEKGDKSPDILIDFKNGIEIECKKKDIRSERDLKNIENWKYISQKASGLMDHFGINYAVTVKTKNDIEQKDVEFILDQLNKFIKEEKEGNFGFQERGIFIVLLPLSKKDQILESDVMQFMLSEDPDYLIHVQEVKMESGKSIIRNPRIFSFKTSKMPDRIMSVINSIKTGKKQLSGNRPGLIYVNTQFINEKTTDSDLKRLDSLIKKVLKENSRISGVVITSEWLIKNDKMCSYSHKTKYIENEIAKNSIPEDFEIVGKACQY